LDEQSCGVCGSVGAAVAEAVESAIKGGSCPFCSSPLQAVSNTHNSADALKAIDKRLSEISQRLEFTIAERTRLTAELAESRQRLQTADEALTAFEEHNSAIIEQLRAQLAGTESNISQTLDAMREEQRTLLAKRKEAYDLRDRKRAELRVLQKKVSARYAAAEADFVPRFRDLAELFLGIDLDITLQAKGATGIILVLELRSTARRSQHQLSESQRFFVDIALRMALAQHMSHEEGKASLFVDTPEGSLDIAYESRAGEMFAKFAESGHDLIMTANINTSQLLKALALECGAERMTLIRMTPWTELSEVQLQAEALFTTAYEGIERELHRTYASA
jgi:DNA repair exonuclease SbcCD ATPase subunit